MPDAAAKRPSLRGPLRTPSFRRLLAAMSVSVSGDWLYNVALLVFVYDRTHSGAWLGAATVVRMAPRVLFGAAAGALADRFDRRAVMVLCDAVRTGTMSGLALLALTGGPVSAALALVFLSTLAGSPYVPAVTAAVPSLVGEEHLAAANTLIKTVEHVAIVLGPAAGALLLALGPPWVAFALNAVTFAVSAAVVSALRFGAPAASGGQAPARSPRIREGLRAIAGSPVAAVLIGCVMAGSCIYGLETVLLVLVSGERLGTGSAGVGYLFAGLGLGGVLASAFTSRVAAWRRAIVPMITAIFAMGLPLVAMVWVRNPAPAFLLMVVQGAGNITGDVVAITVMQRALPADVLGRAAGTFDALMIGAILVGSLVAPALVSASGLSASLVVAGLALPVLTLTGVPVLAAADVSAQRRARELAPTVRLLEPLSIFAGVPRQSLELLAAVSHDEQVEAGTFVVRQGDPAEDFYVVRLGTLEVSVAGGGRPVPQVVNTMFPGDHFGEIGLLQGVPRTASVIARSACSLVRIDGPAFLAVVNQSPSLSGSLWDSAIGRLARTHPGAAPARSVAVAAG